MPPTSQQLQQQIESRLKRGCTVPMILMLLSWGGFFALGWRYVESTLLWVIVLAGGTVFLLGAGAFVRSVSNIGKRRKLAPENFVRPPQPGGDKTMIEGVVESTGEPMKTPFTGRDCVAVVYNVFKRVRGQTDSDHTRSEHTSRVVYYSGYRLRSAAIRTAWGTVRLLAMPVMDAIVATPCDPRRGREFLRGTAFENKEAGITSLRDMFRSQAEVLADSDGTVESDWCLREPADVEHLQFEEKALVTGSTVVATGRYDHRQGAMIPDPKHLLTVEVGTARDLRPGWGWITSGLALGLVIMTLSAYAIILPRLPSNLIEPLPFGSTVLEYRADQLHRALGRDARTVDRLLPLGVPRSHSAVLLAQTTDERVLTRLIEAGADPNASRDGWTPLLRAKTMTYAQALLNSGANPDAQLVDGTTALMIAARDNRPDLAALLLQSGADPSIANHAGETAHDLARRAGIDDPQLLERLRPR